MSKSHLCLQLQEASSVISTRSLQKREMPHDFRGRVPLSRNSKAPESP